MARGDRKASAAPLVRLRRYQAKGVEHLLKTPLAGLFMDPGTGKTLTVLSAFMLLKQKRLVSELWVVAPLAVATRTWAEEVRKWKLPLKVVVLHGPKKDEAVKEEADVYVINYEGLDWLVDRVEFSGPANHRWLVLDESTKVKHANTQRFKTLKLLLPSFGRRTILTGTPAPNGLLDLFGQVYAADGGARLGRYVTQYRREYFYPTGYGGYTWLPHEGAEERIYKALDGFAYRVSDAVLDLPPRHDVTIAVELPAKARRRYDELEREFLLELKRGAVVAKNAGVLGSKLRQVANGAVYDEHGCWQAVHDAKLEALRDLVEQLQGNPLLIGYEFDHDATRIVDYLGGRYDERGEETMPVIAGGVPASVRNKEFDRFNRGELPVLLAQFAVAQHGLNLQAACHHVALFGMTWNLETYIQFTKRVHRGGQTRPVTVHHLIATNTRDERVHQVVTGTKAPTQARLLEALTT